MQRACGSSCPASDGTTPQVQATAIPRASLQCYLVWAFFNVSVADSTVVVCTVSAMVKLPAI